MRRRERFDPEGQLDLHLSRSRRVPWNPGEKWVIFSDLHVGNRRRRDDFLPNSDLFMTVLRDHYLPRGYRLVLNGDIEELQKFRWRTIRERWPDLYALFDAFDADGRLYKTIGNHDARLILDLRDVVPYRLDTVLHFTGLERPLLVYHGHQVSSFFEKHNNLSAFGLRYIALPLGIMNPSVAHDSRRRHALEKRIYDYSRREKIVSVIGHTHRPLFESLTKSETIRFRIEYLLRRYRKVSASRRGEIEAEIRDLREDLRTWRERRKRPEVQSGVYDESDVPVPCVFNSGTVIGKRGMTGLEITKGNIRLVHWFDRRVDDRYVSEDGRNLTALPGGEVFRLVLRRADLRYVMDSIRLLS